MKQVKMTSKSDLDSWENLDSTSGDLYLEESKVELVPYSDEMCPKKETKMRTQNKMVHNLELGSSLVVPPTSEGQSWSQRKQYMLVKKFSRSAAGMKQNDPRDLRRPTICLQTAQYLIQSVMTSEAGETDKSRYHFVFDRLRAVRQDLVVQSARSGVTLQVLEICVRFHLYAGYKFCTAAHDDFDAHLNFTHLLECLKDVLILHEELRVADCERVEMSAVYLLLNLGSPEAMRWGLSLRPELRMSEPIALALEASLSYMNRNHVRILKMVRKMALVHLLAIFNKIPFIIRDALQVMSHGYHSKNCKFPLSHFCRLFIGDSESESGENSVKEMVRQSSLEVIEDGARSWICFNKSVFKDNVKPTNFPMKLIDERSRRFTAARIVLGK